MKPYEGRSSMKKVYIFAVAVALILSGGMASAAGQFGAPESMAQQGKFSFGGGYFVYVEKLKPADDSYLGITDFWQKSTVVSHQAYLQGSYGVAKNWELFGRTGERT